MRTLRWEAQPFFFFNMLKKHKFHILVNPLTHKSKIRRLIPLFFDITDTIENESESQLKLQYTIHNFLIFEYLYIIWIFFFPICWYLQCNPVQDDPHYNHMIVKGKLNNGQMHWLGQQSCLINWWSGEQLCKSSTSSVFNYWSERRL